MVINVSILFLVCPAQLRAAARSSGAARDDAGLAGNHGGAANPARGNLAGDQ